MEELKLVYPHIIFEDQALDYIQEYKEYGSSINGSGDLNIFTSYSDWLDKVEKYHKGDNLTDDHVSSTTYFAIRQTDQKILGMIDIRHALNDYLLNLGGHIGYGVRPSERNKGYANKMLSLALEICRSLDLKQVLITCDKENLASEKVILNNGGVLENEVFDEKSKRVTKRFWITL